MAMQSAILLTFCLASANDASNLETHVSVNDWSRPNVSDCGARLIVQLEAVAQKRRVAIPIRLADNLASRRELATSDNIRHNCKTPEDSCLPHSNR